MQYTLISCYWEILLRHVTNTIFRGRVGSIRHATPGVIIPLHYLVREKYVMAHLEYRKFRFSADYLLVWKAVMLNEYTNHHISCSASTQIVVVYEAHNVVYFSVVLDS